MRVCRLPRVCARFRLRVHMCAGVRVCVPRTGVYMRVCVCVCVVRPPHEIPRNQTHTHIHIRTYTRARTHMHHPTKIHNRDLHEAMFDLLGVLSARSFNHALDNHSANRAL